MIKRIEITLTDEGKGRQRVTVGEVNEKGIVESLYAFQINGKFLVKDLRKGKA